MTYSRPAERHKRYKDEASGKTYRTHRARSVTECCALCCFGGGWSGETLTTFPENKGQGCIAPPTLPLCGVLIYFKEVEVL